MIFTKNPSGMWEARAEPGGAALPKSTLTTWRETAYRAETNSGKCMRDGCYGKLEMAQKMGTIGDTRRAQRYREISCRGCRASVVKVFIEGAREYFTVPGGPV